MSQRRVVVTGLGLVSPVGNDIPTAWNSIINGRSGIGPITHFDASAFNTRIAGEVRDFDVTRWVNPKDARKMDPFIHYGVAAALMAMQDAGLAVTDANAERIGALIGSGIGGIFGIEEQTQRLLEGGPRKVSPFYVPSTIINMLPGHLSILTGIKGPNFSAVSACATSNHSIGMAMRLIQHGDADAMVAGGAERGSSPTSVAGFCSMRAMSTRNDDPGRASRPWDAERDGFVLGDGAGILVLEAYECAKARGARVYCELAGFGASSDAFHMTAPSENGEGPARCVPGSVRVDELMTVESYAHVHHIVSNVRGVLREDITPGQAIAAVFPGGTITGCPKVRCMQIIAELERVGRGAYTGAVGWLNRDGDMDLNILIRSATLAGPEISFRTGAGIVIDSDPTRELDETRAKARGLLRALGLPG